jgi:hypothetical protein
MAKNSKDKGSTATGRFYHRREKEGNVVGYQITVNSEFLPKRFKDKDRVVIYEDQGVIYIKRLEDIKLSPQSGPSRSESDSSSGET